MRNYLCSLLLALAMAPAALASHYASFYVLPMSGHAEGANDTMWVSDIGIQNFQAEPLTVSLVFIQAGTSSFDNVGPLTEVFCSTMS